MNAVILLGAVILFTLMGTCCGIVTGLIREDQTYSTVREVRSRRVIL